MISFDLIGQRFGTLTVLEKTRSSERGYGQLWRLRCDCGGLVERTTAALNYGVREGKEAACRLCHMKRMRERRDVYNGKMRDGLSRAFTETGSLYGHGAEAAYADEIRDEVARILGYYPGPPILKLPIEPFWEGTPGMKDEPEDEDEPG